MYLCMYSGVDISLHVLAHINNIATVKYTYFSNGFLKYYVSPTHLKETFFGIDTLSHNSASFYPSNFPHKSVSTYC